MADFLDFGKVPPPPMTEEEKARLEAKNQARKARRSSIDRLTSAGSRRESVVIKEPEKSQAPSRRASQLVDASSPVNEPPSRRTSRLEASSPVNEPPSGRASRQMSAHSTLLEENEEVDDELEDAELNKPLLPATGLEGAVLCSAELPVSIILSITKIPRENNKWSPITITNTNTNPRPK